MNECRLTVDIEDIESVDVSRIVQNYRSATYWNEDEIRIMSGVLFFFVFSIFYCGDIELRILKLIIKHII